MSSYYWIKLYHEILDDPKMGLMSAELFSFTIKLFLVAGESDKDGELPSVEHIAWRLHIDTKTCNELLQELKRVCIVDCNEDESIWTVINFSERQEAVSSKERVRQYRKRQREVTKIGNNGGNVNVTKRYIDIDTDINITTTAQELSNYFSLKTDKHPKGQIDSQSWDADCQEILDKANGDINRAKEFIDESINILTELGYPRNKPAGLLNTIDNILKPKPQRGQQNGNSGRNTSGASGINAPARGKQISRKTGELSRADRIARQRRGTSVLAGSK